MNGYSVFLGPITGIMITDVSLPFFLFCCQRVLYSDYDSTGSYTARMSMFPRCTSHTAGIGILMAWYGAFRRASRISALSTEHFAELARGRCLLVSVPPTLPGLISSINTKVHIGTAGERLFDIAYLLGVSGLTQFSQPRE
jgi:hypothetical protein